MWVDAAKVGRQTNWKYVMFLLIMAMAALVCGWAVEHSPEIGLIDLRRSCSLEGKWVEAPCTAETEAAAVGDMLYLTAGDTLTVLDSDLRTVYSRTFFGEVVLDTGGFAVASAPLEKALCILDEDDVKVLELSGGIDAVFVGDDRFAVITSGSGYLTNTLLYDESGCLTGQIGLTEEAMVSGAFAEEVFAALSYGKDGRWYLGWYSPEGKELRKSAVDAEICFELRTVGQMLVLRTEDGLLFYEKEGSLLERVSFGTAEFLSWDSGEQDYLALVVASRGKYRLKTLSESGQLLGEAELPMEIRDLEVSGRRVYILDPEALRIYDAFCDLKTVIAQGARAVQIAAAEEKIWLPGNGELMELINR